MRKQIFHGVLMAFLSGLLMFAALDSLQAQEPISPEKQALIKEILVVMDIQKTTTAIMDGMFEQQDKNLLTIMLQRISQDQTLTPQEREELQRKTNEKVIRIQQRFRQLFLQKINFPQLIDEISYSLYDKHFTEAELRDLVTFYKTSTGKKTIEVMPKLFADSMAKISETILPKVQEVMKEVIEEEMQEEDKSNPDTRFKPLNERPAPPAKRTQHRSQQRRP